MYRNVYSHTLWEVFIIRYAAIVIGAGQAGPSLAAFFANAGQKVALAEGGAMGGSCVK